MVHTIGWFIEQALSVLCIFIGVWIFFYILKNGTGAVKDIIRTIGMTVKTVCVWIREKLITKMEEEREGAQEKKGKHEPITYDEFCKRNGYPTKEEFDEMMKNRETFRL